jgi:NACHT domain
LDLLPVVAAAFNDDRISQAKRECLPNTRMELREKIREWSMDRQGKHILWLNGRAGTGKSSVAMTISRQLNNEGRLGASFFFSQQQNEGFSRNFFTTLARHMANLSPELRSLISDAIADHHDFTEKEFRVQWEWLILGPLQKCRSFWAPIVIVIDAMDECDTPTAKNILALLAEYEDPGHLPLKILVTSRPEVSAFNQISKHILTVNLHDEQDSENDIRLFLEHELGEIRERRFAEADWPGRRKTELLAQRSRDLFIFAATLCRFIDVPIFYDENLTEILQRNTSGLGDLYGIYTTILERAAFHEIPETNKEKSRTMLNGVISAAVVLLSTLSLTGLGKLLNLPEAILNDYLRKLGSVLAVSDDLQVRIFHLSFRDYFLDVHREDKRFCIAEREVHGSLLDRCLKIMSTTLKMDICDKRQVDYLPNSDDQALINKCLPEHVQYACRYWVRHFEQSEDLQHESVLSFLQDHFLHWLEALSLLGRTSDGVLMITALHNMPAVRDFYSFYYG